VKRGKRKILSFPRGFETTTIPLAPIQISFDKTISSTKTHAIPPPPHPHLSLSLICGNTRKNIACLIDCKWRGLADLNHCFETWGQESWVVLENGALLPKWDPISLKWDRWRSNITARKRHHCLSLFARQVNIHIFWRCRTRMAMWACLILVPNSLLVS